MLMSLVGTWRPPIRTMPRKRHFEAMHLAVNLAFMLLSTAFLFPLLLVISASFSDEGAIAKYGFTLIPMKFSAFAYQFILRDPSQIFQSYGISIFITVVGSAFSLLIMSMLAYPLSRRDFPWRKSLSFYVFFTLLFNAGVVPFYIFVTVYLHLQNTLQVLILPYLVVPWFVLLLRTYFAGLPRDLIEAAKLDGAGEWRIFFRLILPLSTPALATVGLFSMLMFWNDWWLSLLFIDDQQLFPLQYLLYKLVTNVDAIAANSQLFGIAVPAQTVRMAMAVLAIGPVGIAFVFVQRYFIRGITLGGLKGD